MLRHLATEFSAIAADQELSLKVVPSSTWVTSDAKLLRRVVQNFLSNAIRYTGSGGRILLGCRRLKGYLRIEVWDTGPGIPDDQLKYIFEEFRRLRQGRDKNGLGLGLAIVDRISGMLGHPVNVHSRVGRGSTFTITVPLAKAEVRDAPPATTRNGSRGLSTLRGLKVLCIDNDAHILEGMEALLGNWHCQTTTALSLEDARTALGGERPDIILADYQLDDDQNGLDAMDALRDDLGFAVPGVLITGYLGEEVREDAIRRGYHVLYKPVKPAALRALVNKLIKKRA
ncbi:ATP-binding protein [Marinobacter sp. AN1]|nr:ATP-binding protein [Marinobacter sp. AN1]